MRKNPFKQFQHVCIMPGGYLLNISWNNELKQYSVVGDISTEVMKFLYDPCLLYKDCLLIDIILLIERNFFLLKEILNNNFKYILDELKNPNKTETETEIEYLELYKVLDENMFYTEFHGIGSEIKHENDYYKKGDRIKYAIDFESINNLKNLPITLNQTLKLINNNNIEQKVLIDNNKDDKYSLFTLGDVLYWIVYELTWYGSPTERDLKFQEITKSVKKIQEEYNEKQD